MMNRRHATKLRIIEVFIKDSDSMINFIIPKSIKLNQPFYLNVMNEKIL
jgi:hypothetical protein